MKSVNKFAELMVAIRDKFCIADDTDIIVRCGILPSIARSIVCVFVVKAFM